MENNQLWIEPVGRIIVARVRGKPSVELLKEIQRRVLLLAKETQQGQVLYDALEMDPPDIEGVLVQQKLEEQLQSELPTLKLRSAIVVPNSRIAYLARIAFGAGDHRVFYSDMAHAIKWLEEGGQK